jgi:hypothetical protein
LSSSGRERKKVLRKQTCSEECGYVKGTIGMVLVQDEDEIHEQIVNYISQNLIGPKLKYSHIEKMALAAVHVVQRLRYYILLCKTTIAVDINPFQYILTKHIIGGKYNKWIVIRQEFDLDFSFAKSKKSLVFF